MRRVLSMFSGGLDSLVAVFWMKKLGFEVVPIFFETPFFSSRKALRVANANGLDLKIIDITDEHLKMLISPRYGYGKHFNPCIDCHGLMFRTLKDYLVEFEADFIISGEVLNQRPMSQRYDAMNAVKKLSGIGDLIIRPLSQKRLPDTLPVKEGWVSKEDLLDICGRSRSVQLKIANDFGLKEIENSGGGCLLTDKGYTIRLKEIIDHNQLDLQNIKFLEVGRHFRLNDKIKLIVSRHLNELEYLHTVIKDEVILKCLDVPGPIGVINADLPVTNELLHTAGSILLRYCPKAKDEDVISYGKQFDLIHTMTCKRFDDDLINTYRVNIDIKR